MKTVRFITAVAVMALANAGCSTTGAPSSATQDAIVEAVFRHIAQPEPVVTEDSHGVNLVHKVIFLALDDSQDPAPELLQRLNDISVPVKPMSASEREDYYIFDRATGEKGAAFHIHSIRYLSRSKAEVQADTNPGAPLRGSGFIYRVVCKDGKWSVAGRKLNCVS